MLVESEGIDSMNSGSLISEKIYLETFVAKRGFTVPRLQT